MIRAHLPALQVVIPLLAAPLCALVRRGGAAWIITFTVSWTMPVVSWLMLAQVMAGGPISYELGSWAAPWGIEYRVDAANGFILLLVSIIGAIVATYARRSVAAEIEPQRQAWFYATFMLCLAGLLGMAITGDMFNVFVFMEISSLASYALIALGRSRRALVASYQYLILGTIGATFFVVGVGLLYIMTGTLNMADIAQRIAPVIGTRPVLAALAFLAVGISLKLALFPLHLWLPNAYAFAPTVVTAFLAATATKVAVYLLLRFIGTIFGVSYVFDGTALPEIMLVLSVAAMFAASFVALFQDNLKRMLAYSSVAQIGYITLGIGLASATGLTGSVVHIFNHAVMKGALFLLVGGIVWRAGTVKIDDLAGIGRRMPLTMAGFVLAGLSMIGVPATAGFVSKWYLALAAIEHGWWWMVALIVASSLITAAYVWRVVEVAYFRAPPAGAPAGDPPLSMLLPAWVLVAASIYFGLDTSLTVGVAEQAVDTLIRGLR